MKKRKSGIAIAVILVTAMLLTFTLAACSETSHKHSLTHVDAEESTCTLQGNIEYWECTSCGKYFKDADAAIEARWEELRLPMLEHDYDPATHCCKNCGSYDDEGAQTALSYELNEQKDGYIVSSCGSSATSAVIPDEINGLPVVGIKSGAFENRSNLTSITIPDSVISIGDYAFSGCSGLTSITIPDSVTSIGDGAFSGCGGLTSVTIGNGVTNIRDVAFRGCSGLTSITIPDSVISIGWGAFEDCSGLTNIVIPNSVTSIGNYAFSGCSGLTSITIPFVGAKADGTGYTYFGYIFGASGWNVEDYIPSSLKEVIVTGGTSIDDNAFSRCSGLTSITIPDSVTSIGDGAFSGCSGLTSITIPDSVTSIDLDAFNGCSGLTSVTIGDGVEEIAGNAFYGCTSLSSVNIPNSVKEIGSNAFEDCISLQSIFLPITVNSVGQGAFLGCSQLTIRCEATEDNWSYEWNGGCKVEWGCNAVNTNTDYDYVLHDGKAYLTEYKGDETDITVPTAIDGYDVVDFGNAYQGNDEIVRVVIPEGFTRVERYAFADCSKLTELILPEGLIEFGFNAIYWTQVAKLSFPSSIVKIDGASFNVGTPLIIDIPTIEDWLEVTRQRTLEGSGWSSHYNLYINGESAETIVIPSSVTEIGWYAFNNFGNIKTVILHDGVTSIGENAFYRCSGLTSITIPDSVTSIGSRAFDECSGLTSVTIPDSVTSIGYEVFRGCSGLTSITIPDSVTSIGYCAFSGCSSLTSITIPDSVTSIGGRAFSGCSSLQEIIVAEGNPVYHSAGNCIIETESKTLVLGCNASVIPDDGSVTSIGDSAFYGCSGLTSLVIPDSVTGIGSYAFSGCGINEIVIPIGVTYIGAYAFGANNYWETSVIKCEADSRPSGWDENWTSCVVVWGYPDNDIANDGNKYYTDDLGITYLLRDGNATVVDVAIGENGELTIPGQIEYKGNSYVVTEIAENVLYDYDDLTSITIPFVGEKADGTGATHFGHLFGASDSSYNDYYVPESLNEVIITGGTNIGSYAFRECSSLTSITIPDSVTSIGSNVFYECSGLTEVYYQGDLSGWLGIEFADSSANPMDYTKNVYIDGELLQGDIVIPEGTKKIGDYAFYTCSGLTSVTIPDSVTSIGEDAFRGCSGLTSITIPFVGEKADGTGATYFGYIFGAASYGYNNDYVPESLKEVIITGGTSIGSFAFRECSSLTSITIPDSVTSIGEYAFYGCSGLTSMTIPDSVTSIGSWAFADCSGLTSITIPDSATSIGEYAFYGCSGLTSITIPDSVTSIGNSAFSDCSGLKSITIPFVGAKADGSGSTSFDYIFGWTVPDLLKEVIITGGTSIDSWAFADCNGLTSITIPGSVTSIGGYAFYGCSGLTSITIPDSVTSIGNSAFSGCSGLTSITIPDSVTSIGDYAFHGCSGLTNITIPGSVTNIGEYAFADCSGLTSITIPDSVTSIGEYAFEGCNSLASITIPFVGEKADGTGATHFGYIFGASDHSYNVDHVPKSLKEAIITGGTSIGEYTFADCNGLTSITIPDSVTSIGEYAFEGCNSLASITIPFVGEKADGTGATHFGYIFGASDHSYNVDHVPKSLKEVIITGGTSIGEYAFHGCSGLTSLKISDNIKEIASSAFDNLVLLQYNTYDNALYLGNDSNPYVVLVKAVSKNIESCEIHDQTKVIFAHAFEDCVDLSSFVIPTGAVSVGDYAFSGCNSLTQLVADGEFLNVGSYAFAECSGLKSITVEESIGYKAFEHCSDLESVTIGNGVTAISHGMFFDCGKLSNVTIGDNVTRIDEWAFQNCTSLTNIEIPEGVISVGEGAFSGCRKLESIVFPDSVTSLGEWMFQDCGSLNDVTISNNVTNIGTSVFIRCHSLESITIPDSVTSIGEYAFEGCNSLASITIPDSVTSIGNRAFNGCSKLIIIYDGVSFVADWVIDCNASVTSAQLREGTRGIADNAFSDCSGLTSITIPDSVTSIGEYAFEDCNSLASITIPFVGEKADGTGATHFGYIFGASDHSYNVDHVPKSLKEVIITGGTSIGDYAFHGCSGLTSITIPDSVTSIGGYAFWNCSGLTAINFQGTMAQWQAIEKSSNWDVVTGEYTVHCTDGTISKADA